GVSRSEPKQPSWAKPTSSRTTSTTLGAPARARTSGGHHGFESKWYFPMTPPKVPSHASMGGAYGGRSGAGGADGLAPAHLGGAGPRQEVGGVGGKEPAGLHARRRRRLHLGVVGGMGRVERVQLGVAERNREATQATGGGEIAGDGDVDRRVADAAQAVLVLVLRLLGAVEREPGAARGG